jgi:hypothetical protein
MPSGHQRDILDEFDADRRRPKYQTVIAEAGMVVEDRSSGFVGDVVRWSFEGVTLRDRNQQLRHFTWKPGGFLIDGKPVTLQRPEATPVLTQTVSAAGGFLGEKSHGASRARIAQPHRIWVEGTHDAELLEHVWGDELRELGIVVEPLHGADDLVNRVEEFQPASTRRLGVLLDHLVEGSKEQRIADSVLNDHVLITGHPFVDVWAGIRPRTIGLESWPDVPMGIPWKQGLCDAIGVELEGFWPKLRNSVKSFADLEPSLVGAVEQIIDFVAAEN